MRKYQILFLVISLAMLLFVYSGFFITNDKVSNPELITKTIEPLGRQSIKANSNIKNRVIIKDITEAEKESTDRRKKVDAMMSKHKTPTPDEIWASQQKKERISTEYDELPPTIPSMPVSQLWQGEEQYVNDTTNDLPPTIPEIPVNEILQYGLESSDRSFSRSSDLPPVEPELKFKFLDLMSFDEFDVDSGDHSNLPLTHPKIGLTDKEMSNKSEDIPAIESDFPVGNL